MYFTKTHWKIWKKLKQRRQRQKEILTHFARLHWQQDFRNLDTFHRAMRPCKLIAFDLHFS